MRKCYLFLMMLFVQLIVGGSAFAADPPKDQYDAAIAAITEPAYYIYTEVDGVKFYLTQGGGLTDLEDDRYLYAVAQESGGALYDIGWLLDPGNGAHYSNTTLSSDSKAVLHPGDGVFRQDGGNNRTDWERQVLYMNEEGKIAIRSCNTGYGESSWADAGRAFWTYEVEEVDEGVFEPVYGGEGLMPAYSYEPAYIWEFEKPTELAKILMVIHAITEADATVDPWPDIIWGDRDVPPESIVLGDEYGMLSGKEIWYELYDKLQELNDLDLKLMDEGYDYDSDPEAPTVEEVEALVAEIKALYQKLLDSEIPYSLPFGDGYYRIKSILPYFTDTKVGEEEDINGNMVDVFERSYVTKALLASFENKGMFGTLREDMANQVWYLEQKGDSILMKNVGMGSYISASQTPGSANRIFLTEDESDAACVVFDWAGYDEYQSDTDGDGEFDDWEEKETFNIRLNSKARHSGNYAHQNGHNKGKDALKDLEVSFWYGTFGKEKFSDDGGTSEWYLEPVTAEEVDAMLENFEILKNHDLLVTKNNELRQKVAETLEFAKDIKRTPLIASASQLSSPNSDPNEGANIGNLIDGDTGTFWHTSWHSENQSPRFIYNDNEYHYLQISGMNALKGDCEFYLAQRNGATYDHPSKVVLLGSDDEEKADEEWEVIDELTLPNVGNAEKNTIPFTPEIDEEAYPNGYSFVRVIVTEVKTNEGGSMEHRTYWHASELQIYTVEENPNSQYVLYYEDAKNLEDIYNDNLKIADEDLTPEDYNKLLEAYEVFLGNLVDPTEMRNALTQYAKASAYVVKGTNPGQFKDDTVAKDFDALCAEIDAYNNAGKYKVEQVHKYAAMLKAMSKSLKEGANDVETNKWYRIMYPTEEMFDAYEWSKEGGDNCGDLAKDEQKTLWGTFVSAAKLESEEEIDYDDDGNEVTTTSTWLEGIGGEDLRESDRLFFMNDDEIEDQDASMFRFVELEAESAEPDYVSQFKDIKENMGLAIDLNITKKGEGLITEASQFSSNAPYPGNDGGKLEDGVLIDGNTGTYWHSDYSKTYCAVPYLQVALNEPVSGFIQVYIARRNTSNGHVVRMYVQGSNDAQTWTNIGYIETPYTNATTPVTSQPIDLGGSFKHLRFTMTNRAGSDNGSNIEFDPFAENLTANDYNTKFTYFHASEFQIYPVTVKMESAKAQALLDAYTTENKVLLKDVTEEDFAAVDNVYKEYKNEFNAAQFKTILPEGNYKAPATYALQNKATGLYVMVNGTGNQNNIYLKTIPTLVGYSAIGYGRSLLSVRTVEGVSCNNLHAGESNHRFCTWGTTDPSTNSGLIICEADEEYAAPTEFTFQKNVKPGRIADWCHSVTLTQVVAPEGASAYKPLGIFKNEEGLFLALESIETIPAGEPAFYIYGDTIAYDAEDDYVEPVTFKFSGDEKPVFKGKTVNGVIGTLVTYALKPYDVYANGNYVAWFGEAEYTEYKNSHNGATPGVTPCSAVIDVPNCPEVDAEGSYDFSILLTADQDEEDGVKDISSAIEKIGQPGNVYSMDGKLLRTGATLNSLKALGTGTYILNGVKVIVK